MKIEIWSDIACPFCYIGRRHLELALDNLPFKDDVSIEWRSFQLDPSAPADGAQKAVEMLASKYGMSKEQAAASQAQVSERAAEVGLEMREDGGFVTNTKDAHRLTHLAAEHGLADELSGALFAAHFGTGSNVGNRDVLRDLAREVGLPAEETEQVLSGDRYAAEVEADQRQAQAFGAQGVPFFVIDRKYGISGAQPVEAFEKALTESWEESRQ